MGSETNINTYGFTVTVDVRKLTEMFGSYWGVQGLSFTVLSFVSQCCLLFPSIMAKRANAVVCARRLASPNAVFKRCFIVEMLKQQYPWETAVELVEWILTEERICSWSKRTWETHAQIVRHSLRNVVDFLQWFCMNDALLIVHVTVIGALQCNLIPHVGPPHGGPIDRG